MTIARFVVRAYVLDGVEYSRDFVKSFDDLAGAEKLFDSLIPSADMPQIELRHEEVNKYGCVEDSNRIRMKDSYEGVEEQ